MATCDRTGTAAHWVCGASRPAPWKAGQKAATPRVWAHLLRVGWPPDPGYCRHEVSSGFQRVRGRCPADVAVHEKRVGLHCQPAGAARGQTLTCAGWLAMNAEISPSRSPRRWTTGCWSSICYLSGTGGRGRWSYACC